MVHRVIVRGAVLGACMGAVAAVAGSGVLTVSDGLFRRSRPAAETNYCVVADSNIRRAAAAVLREHNPRSSGIRVQLSGNPGQAQYAARFMQRFALRNREMQQLAVNGFVVPAKLSFSGYADAYHEVYQSQLPVFVSLDSILHAVYASARTLLRRIESRQLEPLLSVLLGKLDAGLEAYGKECGPVIRQDLDLYLTVARSLAVDRLLPARFAAASRVQDLWTRIRRASGIETVRLFGRERAVDFSRFTPRGHYTGKLAPFFRTVVWLSLLEFNILSRSCRSSHPGTRPDPSRTMQETAVAMGLAELLQRTGTAPLLEQWVQVWGFFAGPREDLSPQELHRLRLQAGIRSLQQPLPYPALEKLLKSAPVRTVNTHPMPQGTTVLPVIMTLLGPRIVPEAPLLQRLVDPVVPGRRMTGPVDAAALLGVPAALKLLSGEIKKYPRLGTEMAAGRQRLAAAGGRDLYSLRLQMLRAAADLPEGSVPDFMRTAAYSRLRLNTVIAGWAQLRHNNLLAAAQNYDFGGCEIPDGFVEPAPRFYLQLMRYARRGAAVLQRLDRHDSLGGVAYFSRVEYLARVLRAISRHQTANRPLSVEMRRFLGMISEINPGGTGAPPTYTGWYFDLFYDRNDALSPSRFLTDVYTSSYRQQVRYGGVSGVRMGVFLVNTGGRPRLMAGPVARAFQTTVQLGRRLTDRQAEAPPGAADGWSRAYTVPAGAFPRLEFRLLLTETPPVLELQGAAVKITIEFLDHHRRPLLLREYRVTPEKRSYPLHRLERSGVEAVRLHWRGSDRWVTGSWPGLFWSRSGR